MYPARGADYAPLSQLLLIVSSSKSERTLRLISMKFFLFYRLSSIFLITMRSVQVSARFMKHVSKMTDFISSIVQLSLQILSHVTLTFSTPSFLRLRFGVHFRRESSHSCKDLTQRCHAKLFFMKGDIAGSKLGSS